MASDGGGLIQTAVGSRGGMTPHSVHYGLAQELHLTRQTALDTAFRASQTDLKGVALNQYGGKRRALHARNTRKGSHSTVKDHMPAAHRAQLEWTPGRLLNWAASIDSSVAVIVEYQFTTAFRLAGPCSRN